MNEYSQRTPFPNTPPPKKKKKSRVYITFPIDFFLFFLVCKYACFSKTDGLGDQETRRERFLLNSMDKWYKPLRVRSLFDLRRFQDRHHIEPPPKKKHTQTHREKKNDRLVYSNDGSLGVCVCVCCIDLKVCNCNNTSSTDGTYPTHSTIIIHHSRLEKQAYTFFLFLFLAFFKYQYIYISQLISFQKDKKKK